VRHNIEITGENVPVDVTGCILAGGKSSRYGTDKSLLKIGNNTIIEKMSIMLSELFSEHMIISNRGEDYHFLKVPIYGDIHKNIGPLGGIHSALHHSRTEKIFILSCDLPFMTAELITFICKYPSARPIQLPVTGGIIQPLCGIYSKSCLPFIQTMIGKDSTETGSSGCKQWRYSPLVLIEEMKAELIDVDKVYPEYEEKLFYNINHPEDYEKIRPEFEPEHNV
jgi:molybdenum cofactor guanylyltransferase